MTETLQDRVRPLLAKGMSNQQIAKRLGETQSRVQNACWRVRNVAHRARVQREYDSKRYGTEEYRRWNREMKHARYHNEPAFRASVIATVKRYRERQKEARHVELHYDPN